MGWPLPACPTYFKLLAHSAPAAALPGREMPIRPALMASVSNQSAEDRVGPHMVGTAPWPGSGALADKVEDRVG